MVWHVVRTVSLFLGDKRPLWLHQLQPCPSTARDSWANSWRPLCFKSARQRWSRHSCLLFSGLEHGSKAVTTASTPSEYNLKSFSMLLLNYLSTISWKEKFLQSLKSSLLVSRKEKETKPNMSKEKITVTPCALESGCRIFTNVFQIQNVQNCLPNDMWFQSKQFIFLLNEYLVYRNGKLCGFQLLNQPPCVQDLCWLFHSNIVYLIQTPNTKMMGIFWLLSWVS